MKYLYHSSPLKELNIIKPQPSLSNDKYMGDYVFATEDKLLATMYLVNKGVDVLMNVNAAKPRILIQSTKVTYQKNDIGGAIYTVDAVGFIDTPQVGLSDMEKVSPTAVIPVNIEVFEASLGAFKKANIDVYFINKPTYEKILRSKNEDEAIRNLKPYHEK